MNRILKTHLGLLAIALLPASQALAWGEHGHHLIGSDAARIMDTMVDTTDPETRGMVHFFSDRNLMLGHLANIPDTLWRVSALYKRIAYMNSPTHYFGPERLIGPPGADYAKFLEKVRSLPTDYAELKRQYDGKDAVLPGLPADKRKMSLYEDLGVTPWRAQQLYDLMVSAFACAKSKEGTAQPKPNGTTYPPVDEPFNVPADGVGHSSEPTLPSYTCRPNVSRRADLHAAVVLGGVLAHFIGDQGQPYHPTADHDGWATGNGGIHVYFEALVVGAMDLRLAGEVEALARTAAFQHDLWKKVGTDLKAKGGVTQLLFNLAADSHSYRKQTAEIDDRVAIIEKSATLEWGDSPSNHSEKVKAAVRKPADDPAVLAAFRPLIVNRLATSSVLLARTWLTAWEAAGKPKLSDISAINLPYPFTPPFIWPDFDQDALMRSKAILHEDTRGFLPNGKRIPSAKHPVHAEGDDC